MSLRFIEVVVCIDSVFFFTAEYYSTVCMHHSAFNHPPAERELVVSTLCLLQKKCYKQCCAGFRREPFLYQKKNVQECGGWFVICGKLSGEIFGSSKDLSMMVCVCITGMLVTAPLRLKSDLELGPCISFRKSTRRNAP